MSNVDIGIIASNWPFLGAVVGLWFRLEVGMRGNRAKISELERRFEEERKENREDMKEIKADVKTMLVNQAALSERDKRIHDSLDIIARSASK